MDGVIISVIGFGMVFVILVLLIFIIKLMEAFFIGTAKKKTAAPAVPVAPKTRVAPAPRVVVSAPARDAGLDIAVITAAVAAYIGAEGNGKRFVVRSVRRVNNNVSAWSRSGKSY